MRDEQPLTASNSHYVRLTTRNGAGGEAGIENEGFCGMGVKAGTYTLALNSFTVLRVPAKK